MKKIILLIVVLAANLAFAEEYVTKVSCSSANENQKFTVVIKAEAFTGKLQLITRIEGSRFSKVHTKVVSEQRGLDTQYTAVLQNGSAVLLVGALSEQGKPYGIPGTFISTIKGESKSFPVICTRVIARGL